MVTLMKKHLSNKFVSVLIMVFFVVVTFACFSVTSDDVHPGEVNVVCDTVMSLVDNTMVRTGSILLLMLVTVWLSVKIGISLKLSKLNIYDPLVDRQMSPIECSYLSRLFSSGILHSKLYNIFV